MLNFLSQGNQKQVIGISLTPGVGLEAVILDKTKTNVLNYGRKKIDYNFSTREIQDYVQFKTALVELMDEMKIPPKSFVSLVLPNVYFDFLEIPPTITHEEIKTAILSKAEEFYIFKRDEPLSGWCEVINPDGGTQKRLAYTSFQKSAIHEIKEIITDIGLQLVSIESSYSATLRGLYLSGYLEHDVVEETSWTAMLINTNSYTLFQMEGKNLVDYSEVPLAIKSFSMEEAYQAIVSSSSQLLTNFQSSKLYIISQTDEICAEVLKRQMQYDRETIAIDSNKYSKRPLMEVLSAVNYNEVNSLTLPAIGAACVKSDFNLVLNVMQDDPNANLGVYFTTNILGTQVEVTSELVNKVAILLTTLMSILFGSLIGILFVLDSQAQNNLQQVSSEIQQVDTQISQESKGEVKEEIDMTQIIDEVADMNVKAISFYDAISTDIPKNVWLTKYYNKNGTDISVRGISESIVDIYEYYKNLRIVSPDSNIRLTELKVVTSVSDIGGEKYTQGLAIKEDSTRLYSFEISNTQITFGENPFAPNPEEGNVLSMPAASNQKGNSQYGNVEQPSSQMVPMR